MAISTQSMRQRSKRSVLDEIVQPDVLSNMSRQAAEDNAATCFHCLDPIEDYTDISICLNGVDRRFCCYGCAGVASYIHDQDLTAFYHYRRADDDNGVASGRGQSAGNVDFLFLDDTDLSLSYVRQAVTGERDFKLAVQGLYCSSCSWLIKHAIHKFSDQIDAHLDINALRLRLRVKDPEILLSDIVQVIEKLGYTTDAIAIDADENNQTNRNVENNKRAQKRLAVAGLGMMQVMTFAVALYFGDYQGIDLSLQKFFELVSLIVATVVVFYSGKPFFSHALNDLSNTHIGMDVPIALAIAGAYFPSVYQTLYGQAGHVYFDSAVMFIFFLSLGRYIEMRARHRLTSTSMAMSKLLPKFVVVQRMVGDDYVGLQRTPKQILKGDCVKLVRADVVPFDGIISSGTGQVDESLLTGESCPVDRLQGECLIAGTRIVSGKLNLQAGTDWDHGSIAKIDSLIERAQYNHEVTNDASLLQSVFGRYFVAFVIVLTIVVGAVWWLFSPERVFQVVLAMLVASCPCAFTLAAPTVKSASNYALRKKGILLTNHAVLDLIPRLTFWCFDKTGTLSQGTPKVNRVELRGSKSEQFCLKIAASMEQDNSHVLSPAFRVVNDVFEPERLEKIHGQGVVALIRGEEYRLGKPAWIYANLDSKAKCSSQNKTHANLLEAGSDTVVLLSNEREVLAHFYIHDEIRRSAAQTLSFLNGCGTKVQVLSGDQQATVESSVADLSVNSWYGDLTAEQKLSKVNSLQQQGEVVAMVGDGVNDAPVLAAANLSLVMSSGSELSQSEADIVIMNGRLDSLIYLHEVARRAKRITQQNIAWALAYNLCVLPLAAAGYLTPWLAALGMSLSSLLVVLNAMRVGKSELRLAKIN